MSVAWRAAVIGRWTARIAGTLMALFFLAFFVGEGFPNIFRLPWRESLSVLAMSADGGGVASRLEMGGIRGRGRAGCHGWFYAPDWLAGSCGRAVPGTGGDRVAPRGVLVEAQIRGGGLGGAQESPGRRGAGGGGFHTALRQRGVRHAAADDAGSSIRRRTWWGRGKQSCPPWTRSSPSIPMHRYRAGLVTRRSMNGRIIYNRSWFGRLMHWRTDYLIMAIVGVTGLRRRSR